MGKTLKEGGERIAESCSIKRKEGGNKLKKAKPLLS